MSAARRRSGGRQPVVPEALAQARSSGSCRSRCAAARRRTPRRPAATSWPPGRSRNAEHVRLVDRGARPAHHDQQRPLAPLADARRAITAASSSARMADRGVLERDRADPLAAGADHVLGAVGDLHDSRAGRSSRRRRSRTSRRHRTPRRSPRRPRNRPTRSRARAREHAGRCARRGAGAGPARRRS